MFTILCTPVHSKCILFYDRTLPVTSVLVCAKAIAVGKQVAIEHPNKKIQNVENNGLVEKNKPMLLSDSPIRFAHNIDLGWI